MRPKKGFFKPRHIEKYKGDPTNIVYRSSWELKAFLKLDAHPDIVEWSSEGVIIPYKSPADGRIHRYFVDLYIKYKDKEGNIQKTIIEIKPHKETIPPVKRKGMKEKTWINEVFKYGINQAKWKAAREMALKKGWTFKVWDEYHLGIVKRK